MSNQSYTIKLEYSSPYELKKAYRTDAAYDIVSNEEKTIAPKSSAWISTGLKLGLTEGLYGRIEGRSSYANNDILVFHGIIDSGYTGEVKVKLFNLSNTVFKVKKGDRIAQLTINPVLELQFIKKDNIAYNTDRGTKGFGSSGTNIRDLI